MTAPACLRSVYLEYPFPFIYSEVLSILDIKVCFLDEADCIYIFMHLPMCLFNINNYMKKGYEFECGLWEGLEEKKEIHVGEAFLGQAGDLGQVRLLGGYGSDPSWDS